MGTIQTIGIYLSIPHRCRRHHLLGRPCIFQFSLSEENIHRQALQWETPYVAEGTSQILNASKTHIKYINALIYICTNKRSHFSSSPVLLLFTIWELLLGADDATLALIEDVYTSSTSPLLWSTTGCSSIEWLLTYGCIASGMSSTSWSFVNCHLL